MESTSKPRLPFWENIFLVLWLLACAGVIAVCAWLVIEEIRIGRSLRVVEQFLQTNPDLRTSEEYSRLLSVMTELQKRTALPIASRAPMAMEDLQKRFWLAAERCGEDAEQLAREFAILSDPQPAKQPAASFAGFDRCPHLIVFTEARAYQRKPRYSFRLDFGGGTFPSESFRDLRRGETLLGWRIEGATSRKMSGIVVEHIEKDERGRDRIKREKMPDFEVYRLTLARIGAPDTGLTFPRSERDAARARLSNFEFVSTLSGETRMGEISLFFPGEESVSFKVKAGSEFLALGKNYRVISVRPSGLRLEELDGAREVVWELGRGYELVE
jgi:hypothetical protein